MLPISTFAGSREVFGSGEQASELSGQSSEHLQQNVGGDRAGSGSRAEGVQSQISR